MSSRIFTQLHKQAIRQVALQRVSAPLLSAARPALRLSSSSLRTATCTGRCFSTEAAKPEAGAAAADAAKPADAAALEAKLAEQTALLAKKDAEIKDLQDKYIRGLAENQNTLNRTSKQLEDAKKYAMQGFAKSLLEVADVLEIAVKAAEPHAKASQDANFKNLFEGVEMTQKVLLQIFERNKLVKYEPLGEKFDPHFHDGLLQVEDATKTPGTVGMVLKSGYKMHDRCLRAAQVGTVKAPAKQE